MQRSQDAAIHNSLLSLYVQEESDSHLLEFLKEYSDYYDHKYALRLCLKEDKRKACVIIYTAMRLFEEAVDLALTVDLEEAKQIAEQLEPEENELKKKLWLKIADYIINNSPNGIKKYLSHSAMTCRVVPYRIVSDSLDSDSQGDGDSHVVRAAQDRGHPAVLP
mgnify:FL=1